MSEDNDKIKATDNETLAAQILAARMEKGEMRGGLRHPNHRKTDDEVNEGQGRTGFNR